MPPTATLRNNRPRARAARLVFLLLAATSALLLALALVITPQDEATMTTQMAAFYMGFGLLSFAQLALKSAATSP